MATINKEDMTITVVCQSDDEASARVDLQTLLDDNPGYKPVLVVEDPVGNEITHTDLSAPTTTRRSRATATAVEEEPAEETEESTEDEVEEEPSVSEATDEGSDDADGESTDTED
tara:strand:- start:1562 stop:1906 length:345 start_codon:yes stop_codon:yes gene_type:complete